MGFIAPDIAIDLGTSSTQVYVRGRGIVISEPTIVVTDANNKKKVHAVGDEASYLLGRTTAALNAVMPIRGGTIADFDMTEALIRYFYRKAIGVSHVVKPKVLISVPCSLPVVARKAVEEAARVATGSKKVFLIEKPFAAALGTGLPTYESVGSMVVDIGSGTTDTAVVAIGGLVVAQSIQVGGNKMDEAIAAYIRRESNTLIGARTAENVKKDLGSALPTIDNRRIRIRGRDTVVAGAKDIDFTAAQCFDALKETCEAILDSIQWVLRRTPPELSADIMRNGIHLTGGGSQLFGLDQYVADALKIPVLLAKNPEDSAVKGLGYLLENINLLSSLSRQINEN